MKRRWPWALLGVLLLAAALVCFFGAFITQIALCDYPGCGETRSRDVLLWSASAVVLLGGSIYSFVRVGRPKVGHG